MVGRREMGRGSVAVGRSDEVGVEVERGDGRREDEGG